MIITTLKSWNNVRTLGDFAFFFWDIMPGIFYLFFQRLCWERFSVWKEIPILESIQYLESILNVTDEIEDRSGGRGPIK